MRLFALVFLFAGSAFASDYYVDSNGSDVVGQGTQQSPWQTLDHAFASIDQCDANIWLTAGQNHVFTTLHWNNQLPPALGGWDECETGGTWQIAGHGGVANLTSNNPFPFDISRSSNPGWPVINPDLRNKLILRDLHFSAGPDVIALAIPAAGDFAAINLTTDAGLTFGWGGEPDQATKHRTIEITDSDITAPPGRRPLLVRFAESLIIRNTTITSALSAVFLEAEVETVHIENSSLTSCPIHPVIEATSAQFPFEGCSIVVLESTLTGRQMLTFSGLTPELGLHGAECCDCSQNCAMDSCGVQGGDTGDCCEQIRENLSLADLEAFTSCLTGPDAGLLPGCLCLDLVGDSHFDLRNYGAFQEVIAEK